MSYNQRQFHAYLETAGKITVFTAIAGIVVFSLVFLLNLGAKEFKQAIAQDSGVATTSVTVLNTPPSFDVEPFEDPGSATTSPTNSGDTVTWRATATDPSDEDWFLLICDGETASPTAVTNAPPTCGAGDTLIAVSGTTTSGSEATAATTTTEAMAESNDWYAWACDSVTNARCTVSYSQGAVAGATSSSPFNVNHRPNFSVYYDDSPADPGALVTFSSDAADTDTDGGADTVQLHVCSTEFFNSTSTFECGATTIATSTFVAASPTATYTIVIPTQDDDFEAWGYVIDNHNHLASGGTQGTNATMTVNNVAPTISTSTIDLNGGLDMTLVTEGGETTGFTLDFQITDNNSCDAVGGNSYDEIQNYALAVYRSGVGTSTCVATSSGAYNANNCYPSYVATTTWNHVCTASTTSCTFGVDGVDRTLEYNCTFPLWYVADPTDGTTASDTVYFNQDWRAAIIGVDDDGASSTYTESGASDIEVESLLALNLVDTIIAYGALEPGNFTDPLTASTTIETTGNTGLDQDLTGEAMCNTYQTGSECDNSATSTIPDYEQRYSTSSVAYFNALNLSSSTASSTLLTNIAKSTSTVAASAGDVWWGIRIPATITFAGSYTGENTFTAVVSDPSFW